MLKGIIFDLDGVILDTEKLYTKFWVEAANACGYPMKEEHVLGIRSLATQYAAEKLKREVCSDFDIMRVKQLRIKLMSDYVNKYGVEAKPGAYEALKYINEHHVPCALATATPYERAKSMLESVGLFDSFNKIACAYMVKHGKPKPDVYIFAAGLLQISPIDCMAVEDSPNGIMSAYEAGCKTVMIPDSTLPDDDIKEILFDQCNSLFELTKIIEREFLQ
ncbi:MAG: HAD family phosphatase [Clostridiales bacterium]|nr:HAD family phosphatase [Clostridiales bacterium]